jgi:hypothetical protein
VRSFKNNGLLAYSHRGHQQKVVHLHVFCKICGLGYRKDNHLRHVERNHKDMYDQKKDVGLLKDDEEPVDPIMTNWP